MPNFRKRTGVYIAMGGLVGMGMVGMLALLDALPSVSVTTERLTIVVAVLGTIVTGIVGLGHKAIESEEKGQ